MTRDEAIEAIFDGSGPTPYVELFPDNTLIMDGGFTLDQLQRIVAIMLMPEQCRVCGGTGFDADSLPCCQACGGTGNEPG